MMGGGAAICSTVSTRAEQASGADAIYNAIAVLLLLLVQLEREPQVFDRRGEVHLRVPQVVLDSSVVLGHDGFAFLPADDRPQGPPAGFSRGS
jgi:hypothetical protein